MVSQASTWVTARERGTSFERLFLAEYSRVVAIARHVLGDPVEAEDVAQEVFCSFYRAHPPDAEFASAWLHRAAAHSALNVIRGNRRRRRREETQALAEEPLRRSGDANLEPERAAVAEEQRREIHAALRRIPEKSAAILALRYSGLSYAEVAQALGVGVGQIGTQLRRAEAALKKEMTNGTP